MESCHGGHILECPVSFELIVYHFDERQQDQFVPNLDFDVFLTVFKQVFERVFFSS